VHLFFNDPRDRYVTRHRRLLRPSLAVLVAGGVGVAALGVMVGQAGVERQRGGVSAPVAGDGGMALPVASPRVGGADAGGPLGIGTVPAAPVPVLDLGTPTATPAPTRSTAKNGSKSGSKTVIHIESSPARPPATRGATRGATRPATEPATEAPTAQPAPEPDQGPAQEPTTEPAPDPTTEPAEPEEPVQAPGQVADDRGAGRHRRHWSPDQGAPAEPQGNWPGNWLGNGGGGDHEWRPFWDRR
jgi:hypothetical protein